MRLFGKVNALQIMIGNDMDILLAVIYAEVNDGELDVCFRRGTEYVHKVYETGTWTAVKEV